MGFPPVKVQRYAFAFWLKLVNVIVSPSVMRVALATKSATKASGSCDIFSTISEAKVSCLLLSAIFIGEVTVPSISPEILMLNSPASVGVPYIWTDKYSSDSM